ncbi:MAG: PASTA domain-containing protein [Ruminococcaceae bacterium]|nr:PASTA domain-containing protein [Oscillospiraceae bacterium]
MDAFEKYIGQIFDNRYKIVKVIGIGGMAVVFEAFDMAMKRPVAIKMLKDEITHDAASVKRFVNESRAVSMLSHPNIVSIYDVSVKENLKYIVMERVEGITLKSYMQKKGILSLEETLSFSEQILRALEHAHSKGVVHRDIKPQNIMLLKNGRIKVTDFGIAKLPNAETVTMTDKAIGTVYYISPEQASGKQIDARSDLYSLGVMIYEMATGKLPFTADSPVSVALMQVNKAPVRPRQHNPKIPIGLEQIILNAMAKDPSARFQSAGTMLRHILQIRSNPSFVFKMAEVKTETKEEKDEEKYDSDESTGNSIFPIIAGVFAAFLTILIACGVVLLSQLSEMSGNDPYTIVVENFVGKQYDAVMEDIDRSVYKVKYELVYSADHEPGTIISQDPKSGEQRKVKNNVQYCEIEFAISQGEQVFTLPDISVKEYRTERQDLVAKGYNVEIIYENNDIIMSGYVIKTDPEAGTVLRDGQTITFYVSSGQNIVTTTVPNFIGLKASDAMRRLVAYDLALGDIKYEYSWIIPKGEIISQSIDEGTEVPGKYTKISFVVSCGEQEGLEPPPDIIPPPDDEKETEEGESDTSDVIPEGYMRVPDLRGLSFFQTIDLLSDYDNLSVGGLSYGNSDEYSSGTVMEQSIVPNSLVREDTKFLIDIVMSQGPK